MTEKLFYSNAYMSEFTASVLSCTRRSEDYAVELDKTAFFPEGGGQPGDTGFIGGAEVTDTVESDGRILHICRSACREGDTVACKVNFDYRFLNMQQHTGEHIFSGIIHSITGFDNVGFHMGSQFVTVDFNGKVSEQALERAEKLANAAVYADKPVEVFIPSEQELERLTYRSKKELEGDVRLVRIEGCDLCACCGTHVARTGEVGIIKAVSMINYKSGVRITLMIGSRALADYAGKNTAVHCAAAMLSAKPEELTVQVDRLLHRLEELKAENAAIKHELLCCKSAGCGAVVFDGEMNPDSARELCNLLADRLGTAAVFCGADDRGYKYTVISRTQDIRELCKGMNDALNGRGGGKADMVCGSLAAPQRAIEEFIADKIDNACTANI